MLVLAIQKIDNMEDDLALIILNRAKKITSTCNCDLYRIKTFELLNQVYFKKVNYRAQIICLLELEHLYLKYKHSNKLRRVYDQLAKTYIPIGDSQKAISYYYEKLNLCGKKDTPCIAQSYIGISKGRAINDDFDEAMKTIRKGLNMMEALNDSAGIVSSCDILGQVYTGLNKYDSAELAFKRTIELSEKLGLEYQLAKALHNLGNNYARKRSYDKALVCYIKALSLADSMENVFGQAVCNLNIGGVYNIKKQYDKALKNLLKGLGYAKDFGFVSLQSEIHYELSVNYENTGNIDKAFYHHKQFILNKDSFLSEKEAAKQLRLEMEYKLDQKKRQMKAEKENEVFKEKEKNRQQKRLRDIYLIIIIVIFSLLGLIFYMYKQMKTDHGVLEEQKGLIQKQQQHIMDSINYAQRLQVASLMPEKHFKSLFKDSFIYLKPKSAVSGDIYWAAKINDIVVVAAIDCTGHGVPGGLMSMIANTLMNKIILDQKEYSPSKILKAMDQSLYDIFMKNNDGEAVTDGMDISLGVFDINNKSFCYAGASHDIYHYSDNKLSVIQGSPYSVGGISFRRAKSVEKTFDEKKISYNEGDRFYFYSDGIVDQFGGKNNTKINNPMFKKILLNSAQLDMSEQTIYINERILEWMGDVEQTDDMLILGIAT
jgi:serine phosphatase RsbU (regulator of sigma subunit)